ncbi:AAA family ATPase [Pseudomonadota bacterium]
MCPQPDHHARLIEGLLRPEAWPEPVAGIERIETHISTVLLVGEFAYKIKKPVDLGFLDFSTLARRKLFCEEELRLNGRLAPHIYLDAVPITGTLEQPRVGGDGPAIDYAVKMRQFPADALLSKQPERLNPQLIDEIAAKVADFHGRIAVSDPTDGFGAPAAVFAPMEENFTQIRALLDDDQELLRLDRLLAWTREQHRLLQETLEQRRRGGFIRECHGDMHLGNIAMDGDEILIFDGIEFNPNLRWIDIINEVAFLFMDLEEKGRSDLAWRFLNVYIRYTGDFEALPLLRFYLVYRAMVRAKVAAIRSGQAGLSPEEKRALKAEYLAYVVQAEGYTRPSRPGLIINHGVSGSGKSTATIPLVGKLQAVRIRSDVERKRLAGLDPWAVTDSAVGQGIYSPGATEKTYGRLLELAEMVIKAGYVAIVDATFLRQVQRRPFYELARRLAVSFLILDFQAPEAMLRERIGLRLAAGADPSEANLEVLEMQLKGQEPLTVDEMEVAIGITPELALDEDAVEAYLAKS